MAWLFVWTLLHLLSLLTTAPPLDALHLLQYILFFSATLFTWVWRTLNGKWKELFHDACLWSEALFIMLKWEDGLRNGWGNQSFLPNIRLKPTEQENFTRYLIFDHFGRYTVHIIQHLHMYVFILHRVFSLHFLAWMWISDWSKYIILSIIDKMKVLLP